MNQTFTLRSPDTGNALCVTAREATLLLECPYPTAAGFLPSLAVKLDEAQQAADRDGADAWLPLAVDDNGVPRVHLWSTNTLAISRGAEPARFERVRLWAIEPRNPLVDLAKGEVVE